MSTAPAALDAAFTELFDTNRERIRIYILGMVRDAAEAEDLTQETFIHAYRGLEGVRDPAALPAWLYRIATHACYDRFRRSSRRPQPASLDVAAGEGHEVEPADTEMPSLELVIDQAEMSACVRGYLDQLGDDHRRVILLHDVEGLTNPEIAQMLGTSLDTVKIRVHRARRRLQATLDAACEFSCDERGVLVCEPAPARRCP